MKAGILLIDVDGVVTDRYARVSVPVVRELLRLSGAGVKIAFVTGRSERWLRGNLMGKMGKRRKRDMLFLCEFGSVVVGKRLPKSAMPARYVKLAKKIAGAFPTIEYDDTKETMISMEADMARAGAEGQLEAAGRMLDSMVKGDGRFRVLRSTYAVDVLRRGVGKRNAARFALKEFGGRNGKRIVVIGDSAADLEMALPGCTFYFVGEKTPGTGVKNFARKGFTRNGAKLIFTRKKFSEGALAVLEKLK